MLSLKKTLLKIIQPPQTIDLSNEYGVIFATKSLYSVTITITGLSTTINNWSWTTICTLPDGFRPWKRVDFVGYDNNTNDQSKALLPFRLNVNGTLTVWAYETSNKQLCASITFTTAGDS